MHNKAKLVIQDHTFAVYYINKSRASQNNLALSTYYLNTAQDCLKDADASCLLIIKKLLPLIVKTMMQMQ